MKIEKLISCKFYHKEWSKTNKNFYYYQIIDYNARFCYDRSDLEYCFAIFQKANNIRMPMSEQWLTLDKLELVNACSKSKLIPCSYRMLPNHPDKIEYCLNCLEIKTDDYG